MGDDYSCSADCTASVNANGARLESDDGSPQTETIVQLERVALGPKGDMETQTHRILLLFMGRGKAKLSRKSSKSRIMQPWGVGS